MIVIVCWSTLLIGIKKKKLVSCLLEAVSLILRNVYCLAGIGIAIASQTVISRLLHADIREGEAGFEAEQDTLPFSLAERIRCVCHCEIVTSFECRLTSGTC